MIEIEKKELAIGYREEGQIEVKFQPQQGKNIVRRSVPGGKLKASTTGSDEIASNSVTKAKMADDAIGQSELDYEVANITITGTNTTGTATVTSSSVPLGYYLTAFTTPAASYVQLAVSGTTLTATLSAAPGVGNSISIRIILIKT